MPVPARGLSKTRRKWIWDKPTMHEKLKNLEREMDPAKRKKITDDLNRWVGKGTTENFWEQGPTRSPPDPDVEAMVGAKREGLMPIRHENKSYRYAEGGKVR